MTGATPVIQGKRELGNFGDVGATIGGYIIKDKLWFFAGLQWAAQRYIYSRSFNRLINGAFEPIPDSTQRRNGDERSWNYIGKLTFLISPDHRLSLTVTGTPTTGGGDGGVALRNRSNNRNPFTPAIAHPGHLQRRVDAIELQRGRRRRRAEQQLHREAAAPRREARRPHPAGLVPPR